MSGPGVRFSSSAAPTNSARSCTGSVMPAPRPMDTSVDPPRGCGPAWERPGARSASSQRPEIVPLAEIHAVVAQQRVGRGHVEVEVRVHVVPQVELALEHDVAVAARHGDVALVAAVDGRGGY